MHLLLLHPPQSKPAEPPAGLPLLAAAVRKAGGSCTVCDLNLEGLYHLLKNSRPQATTWSKRAHKNLARNIETLRQQDLYNSPDKYRRAVADLNKVLDDSGKQHGVQLSLGNYQQERYSPLDSYDLEKAANNYTENIYYPFFARRLEELIQYHTPDVIGFSLNYLSQAICTFAMIGFLRHKFPEIRRIAGGGLVTTWLQNGTWPDPLRALLDHLICGPGERLLPTLLGLPDCGRARPDYSDLRDLNYISPGFILPYAASTGCFWRKCSFCPETSEKNSYSPVPAATVIAELSELTEQTDPSMIHLVDNAVSPAVLSAICAAPLSVPWYGFVRFTPHLADPEFCRKLRKSGCVMLKLGLESGSQRVLDKMQKGIRLELVSKALHALYDAGIMTYVYLLFGTPAESAAEARETMHFTAAHHTQISYLNLAVFNLPVGSAENDQLELSKFYQGDLSLYSDFVHPLGWNRARIRQFLDREFKRHPRIKAILNNDPIHFTSNHAALFSFR